MTKIECTKNTATLINAGWKEITKIESTQKKSEDPRGEKYEHKELDCPDKKYFYKSKVVTTPAPGPISSRYQDCTGPTYKKTCKDPGASKGKPNPEGIIYKVQGCIGAKQDSKFWTETETQLKLKTGRNYFTTDEVDAICSGKLTPDGTQQQVVRVQQPGTKEYWENLIKNKQITKQGLIIKTRLGYFIYVIKIDKIDRENPPSDVDFNTIKKYPISTIKEVDSTTLESYDYVSFYPISGGREEGAFAFLKTVPEMDGGEKVVVDTNFQGKWSPEPIDGLFGDEEKDMFSPLEETISKTIKKALNEQRIKFYRPGQANTGTSNTGNQTKPSSTAGAGTTPSGSGVTNVKPNPNDVKKVIEPIRVQTVKILKDIQDDIPFKDASAADKEAMQDAINLLQNFDSSKACDQIDLIDTNISQLDNLIKQNEGKFGTADIVSKVKEVRSNLQTVKSECKRLESEAIRKSSETTKPQGGQQTTTQPNSGQPQPQPNQNTMNQEKQTIECSPEKIVEYIVDGLQGISSEYTKIKKQKEDLCYCYKIGKFNDMNARGRIGDLFKEKIEDIKNTIDANVAPEKQISRRWRNKKLGWNEITKLIRGEALFGVKLDSNYIDRTFGTDKCKASIIKESSLKNVSSLISEAVVAKRKEKTRDVIVEDILKSLRGH